jgi:hypothetical protein
MTQFVKPATDIHILSSSVELMVKSLTHNDVITFSGGKKDIGKNNYKRRAKKYTELYQNKFSHKHCLLTVPHKYDLESWACVNDERKS